MSRIALYGGSFDPPHLGHVITITAVLNSGQVDEVWLVPTGLHPDKASHASPESRKQMVAVMLATMFGSKVPVFLNTTQINRPWQPSTTADLVQEIERRYPEHEFRFVIGSDLVTEIPKWHQAETLMLRERFFLVVPRLGDPLPEVLPSYTAPIPMENVGVTNISSSLVRARIVQGMSLEGMVPPAVISHILRNRLYQPASELSNGPAGPTAVYEGRFIRCLIKGRWEYVRRTNCTGVAIIVAMTQDRKVLFTEQFRIPVDRRVIEFPAGLVNDLVSEADETLEQAAARELLEETGYWAERVTPLTAGPVSAGLTSEVVTMVQAKGLRKESNGGGDGMEKIAVHEIPLDRVESWLTEMQAQGKLVDPKIYAGLFFLKRQANAKVPAAA